MRGGGAFSLAPAFVLLASSVAHANGRFPNAGLVAFDPNEAGHFAVRTTFGLLESRDDGKSFDYVCESALKLGLEEDPMLAFTGSGGLVVATFGGVLTSGDGCSFSQVPELEGQVVPDLARSASEPDTLFAYRLFGLGDGRYQSGLVRSDDAGSSWTFFPLLPEEFLPTTVDIAARDSARVYLTARRGPDDEYDSVLLVSDDGGGTFRTRSIPETSGQNLAYIAGVHPSDPDRLAVRVNGVDATLLLESRDAGESFERLFSATGRLTGFAYSADGDEMAFGGPDDGLWVGTSDGAYGRRSDVRPTCLAWNEGGLWACADAQISAFSFGRSMDEGRTFEPLVTFSELCGRSSCGEETDVGTFCPGDWQNVAPTLAATCNIDGGVAPDAAPDAGPATRPTGRGGCSVAAASTPAGSRAFFWALVLLKAARWRRARAAERGSFRFRPGSPNTC